MCFSVFVIRFISDIEDNWGLISEMTFLPPRVSSRVTKTIMIQILVTCIVPFEEKLEKSRKSWKYNRAVIINNRSSILINIKSILIDRLESIIDS